MRIGTKMKLSELCFYIFWFFLQLGKGLGYTSKDEDFLILLICGIPFALFRLVLMRWSVSSLLKCLVLNALGLVTVFFSKSTAYLLSIVCITAVKDMDIKKLLKVVLTIRGPLFVVRTSLAIIGRLDMELVYRVIGSETIARYALGYGHPNTAQYELFMLVMLFFFLYQERLTIFHFAVALIYNQYIYQYTDSKTSYYLCVLFVLSVFICTRRHGGIIKKVASVLATNSWILGVTITVAGCVAYSVIPEFRNLGTFSSRFLTATKTIRGNRLSLFGASDIVTDLGYVNLLYSGGLILTGLFFCSVNQTLKNKLVSENVILLLAFACFSIFNIMESYTYSVLSNCLLLFLVSVVYPYEQQTNVIERGK